MKKIWFDKEYIYAETDEGEVKRQSLLWYPALKDATDEERNAYRKGFGGYHWRNLDVDISFDSFLNDSKLEQSATPAYSPLILSSTASMVSSLA